MLKEIENPCMDDMISSLTDQSCVLCLNMEIEQKFNRAFEKYRNQRKLWLEPEEITTFQYIIARERGFHISVEMVREVWADYSKVFNSKCLSMHTQKECVEIFDAFIEKYE